MNMFFTLCDFHLINVNCLSNSMQNTCRLTEKFVFFSFHRSSNVIMFSKIEQSSNYKKNDIECLKITTLFLVLYEY